MVDITNRVLVFFFIMVLKPILSQENEKDSLKTYGLSEVIITGQLSPQSIKKSVFEVTVIKREEIEKRAAVNLADLLNQTLNITVLPEVASGKSGIKLFGLDNQYFKVLVDNIPIISDEGFGNNVDLSMINLNDIERIEIVEGSMGVQYGANAISGVINIVTKKNIDTANQITAFIQEETVGKEYQWFEQGKHVQNISYGHRFADNISLRTTYTRNDFGGFWDARKGENYDKNDKLRGHSWLPKLQHNAKLLAAYNAGDFKMFYNFEYFYENISKFNQVVNLNENPSTATRNPIAKDRLFFNHRYVHHLNLSGKLGEYKNYNVSLSYQKQEKNVEDYDYTIRKKEKSNISERTYLSREVLFSRGTLSGLLYSPTFNMQAGYEVTLDKGFGSSLAVLTNESIIPQKLNNYDLFVATEIKPTSKFSLRPEGRVSFSNMFKNQFTVSLSSSYRLNNGFELKGVLGSGNRTPNYNELYTYFVDSNHNMQGNRELEPEQSFSIFLHLKKIFKIQDDLFIDTKLSGFYMNIKDRIELSVVNKSPLAFKYLNVDDYKAHGFTLRNTLNYHNLSAQLGVSVTGASKILNKKVNSKNDFLYNLQLNASLNYTIPKWNSAFSVYYKHIGKEQQFVQESSASIDGEFLKGTTDAYNWLDVNVKKMFFNKKIGVTIGVRNILDVVSSNTSALSGGVHSAAEATIPLAYGRSYFLNLKYNLNF